ncbi:MAG: DJ-1 family glyoxalase III [Opitutaceae bacterium]
MATNTSDVLVVLAPGVEEMEAVTPIDLLRRAGFEVTTASIDAEKTVVGRNGIPLVADTTLAEVEAADFDLVVLPGGPGVKHLRASMDVLELARRQAASGRLLGAICAAPTALHDAGVLHGRRYTAHFSVESELPDVIKTEDVVRDGNIVTSRGAGTAIAFSLELITILKSAEVANQVAESICLRK